MELWHSDLVFCVFCVLSCKSEGLRLYAINNKFNFEFYVVVECIFESMWFYINKLM